MFPFLVVVVVDDLLYEHPSCATPFPAVAVVVVVVVAVVAAAAADLSFARADDDCVHVVAPLVLVLRVVVVPVAAADDVAVAQKRRFPVEPHDAAQVCDEFH